MTHFPRQKSRRTVSVLALVIASFVFLMAQDSPSGLRIISSSTTTSLTQYGITWTFSDQVEYGQYVNGDYWVVGPVEIVEITPASVEQNGRVTNGSMVNPDPENGNVHGFDSAPRDTRYDATMNAARPGGNNLSASNPLVLEPESSLVSSISHPEPQNRPQITDAAVLTVVTTPPADDGFRPPYSGTNKTARYNYGDLDTSRLQRLAPVASTPSLSDVARDFQRPWLDFIQNWTQRDVHPRNNMETYGRDIASQVGVGALMLHLDYPVQEKRDLLVGYVQVGIDLWGLIQDGGSGYPPNGGHASGRKWPILFAGLMLGDSEMQNVGPGDGTGTAWFGEDGQTFFVSSTDIGMTLDPDDRNPAQEYDNSHLNMPEWGIRHATDPVRDNADWRATYRTCCTGVAWSGYVLAAHIMNARALWAHEPLFEYQDRYMKVSNDEDDGYTVNGEPTNTFPITGPGRSLQATCGTRIGVHIRTDVSKATAVESSKRIVWRNMREGQLFECTNFRRVLVPNRDMTGKTATNRRPILVTGSHRSGTTWVGKMIASSGAVGYIHEPFNPGLRISWCPGVFDRWFQYVGDDNERFYTSALERVVEHRFPVRANLRRARDAREQFRTVRLCGNAIRHRMTDARVLIKDPIAFFSAEWLAKKFDAMVIVMLRHPAAFAASIKAKKWNFDFANFLNQTPLMERHLSSFSAKIEQYATRAPDIVEQAILLWNCIHATIHTYQRKHENWFFLYHETLASDPENQFSKLLPSLGLDYTGRVEREIRTSTAEGNQIEPSPGKELRRNSRGLIQSWKYRLTEEEILRIRKGTEQIAPLFYQDSSW